MNGFFKGIKKVLLIIWVFFSSFFFVNAIFHETGIIQLPEPEYKFTQGPIEDFFSSVLVLCFWLLVIAFGTYHLDPKRPPDKGYWKFNTYLPPRQTSQLTPLFSGIICYLFLAVR